jgi:hypothetical protein
MSRYSLLIWFIFVGQNTGGYTSPWNHLVDFSYRVSYIQPLNIVM